MSFLGATVLLGALLALAGAVLLAMAFLFATLTGWRELSGRYPARGGRAGERYRVAGAVFGTWSWNAPPLEACVDDDGVVLHARGPFRIAFPSVRLPWAEITGVTLREYMFFAVAEVRFGRDGRGTIGFERSPLVDVIARRVAAR